VYNNKVVLDGTLAGQFQVGTEKGQTISFAISSIDTDALKLTDLDDGNVPVAAEKTFADGTYAIDTALMTDGSTTGPTATSAGVIGTAAAAGTMATGTAGAISILTATDASDSLAIISAAIEQVAENRASYGALQNRLEYTVSNLMNVAEFTTSARSRIEDADFAAESARLAKAQVLQQTGTAMLAQANAAPQLALQLIRN
jgi:flagellin